MRLSPAPNTQRAKDLYEHGAIALNDLQVAQDGESKAEDRMWRPQ